ncbi:chromate efflux transporter [Seleniivibrio woodruffii]|uniref:chromate efflux transporter n=1 Tax=Seleniivibrio woodruffii TaxID=1078050 RepID=UPI0039E3BF5E
MRNIADIFVTFLWLGLRSFGGPIAHFGYFYSEFVNKKKWLSEKEFSSLTALCQFLPGPASSQTGFGIGLKRGGIGGAYAAWLGFTLPSAAVMTAAAYGLKSFSDFGSSFAVKGLLILTAAVVAQAVWAMGTKLCPDTKTRFVAVAALFAVSVFRFPFVQVIVIIAAGIAGYFMFREGGERTPENSRSFSYKPAVLLLGLFFGLLILLPVLAGMYDSRSLKLFDTFYRAGALVFGGGHVVLPLLHDEIVAGGYMADEMFLSGYGIAQIVPGPLFTFASFAGTVSGGIFGGLAALTAVFMSTFLLIPAVMPIWDRISEKRFASAAMKGINASVVGILGAALYDPVWVKGVASASDFALFCASFGLLMFSKTPVWAVTLFCLAGAFIRSSI